MRGSVRMVSGFVALVWIVNFAVCSQTKGLVPSTGANITAATDQLGEWRFLGDIVVYAADIVLGVAALGFYAAAWMSWCRHIPPATADTTGSPAGRVTLMTSAIGAQIRVFLHLALVFVAVGNFPPLGWASLAVQGVAVAALVMALFVLRRAARLAGAPHADAWIVGVILVLMSAATAGYVVVQVRGG